MLERLSGANVVITGGAGFLGSHLSTRLLALGAERVVAIDNLITGRRSNIAHLADDPRFTLIEQDVTTDLAVDGPVSHVLHFASPASPIDYLELPIQTLKVGALGTHKACGLAMSKAATLMIASTSEVYGDPQVHPQPETYWGHVNPIGPRGVYDEAKRYAEAMTYAYHRAHGVDVRVPRIFNTFGERMRPDDGRAVPTFVLQALANEPMTVHGDGEQTRSLIYVDDEVEGLLRLLASDYTQPCNIGNPTEMTVLQLAEMIRQLCGSSSEIVFTPRPTDDPTVRQPDISVARRELGWEPVSDIRKGLARTVASLRIEVEAGATLHRGALSSGDGS